MSSYKYDTHKISNIITTLYYNASKIAQEDIGIFSCAIFKVLYIVVIALLSLMKLVIDLVVRDLL